MTNGANYAGTITLGDMDMWSLHRQHGRQYQSAVGHDQFRRLAPTLWAERRVAENGHGTAPMPSIDFTATNSGTFTVLVSS